MIPAGDNLSPLGHPRFDCHAPWDDGGHYAAVTCPDGHVVDTPESAALACERMRLACPNGLVCLCRPCLQDMVLKMYSVEVPKLLSDAYCADPMVCSSACCMTSRMMQVYATLVTP